MDNSKLLLDNQNVDRSFIDQLSDKELGMLRQIVKRIHMKHYPEEYFSNEMADMLICKFGAEYGEKMIKKAVDAGIFT